MPACTPESSKAYLLRFSTGRKGGKERKKERRKEEKKERKKEEGMQYEMEEINVAAKEKS